MVRPLPIVYTPTESENCPCLNAYKLVIAINSCCRDCCHLVTKLKKQIKIYSEMIYNFKKNSLL